MGELEAKESICQLEYWMDASSIVELWWLQGSLLCGNAIGKAITACTIIRPNDLDPGSLMTAIHSVQMAGNLSNMTLSHINKQESIHTHLRKNDKGCTMSCECWHCILHSKRQSKRLSSPHCAEWLQAMREIYSSRKAVVYVFNQAMSEHPLWSCPASGNKSPGPVEPLSWFKYKMSNV